MNEDTKKRALRMLEKRDYSHNELIEKLVQKGEPPEAAEAAADRFVELGLINDVKYAGMVARHYAGKGYGRSRIRGELLRRRVPRELWDEALGALPEPDDKIDRLLRQKLKSDRPDRAELKRAIDALCRRGFSWEEIHAAVARYQSEFEEA
jgi:regulatory protein